MSVARAGSTAAIAALLVTLTACGGNVDTTPASSPAAPPLSNTSAFTTSSTVAATGSSTATTLSEPLPASGTYSGSIALPVASVPAGTSLKLTYSSTPPQGVSAFSDARSSASASSRSIQDALSSDAVYACFQSSTSLTLTSGPQYQFALPAAFAPANSLYYLALLQGGQWAPGYGTPATVANVTGSTVVSISGIFGFQLPPNQNVCVALFARWNYSASPVPATPLPSASPTVSATATPSPLPTASPAPTASPTPGPLTQSATTLTFTNLTTPQALTLFETANATFTETDTCTGIATVTPSSTTAGSAVYAVTPVAAGSCAVSITDGSGRSATTAVTISTTALTVQSKARI